VRERGQATAQYVLVTAGVAIVCIVALVFVLKPLDGILSDPRVNTPSRQPFTPPDATGTLHTPTSLADCANQGWRSFDLHFDNQAECEAYVRGDASS
jgi:hypothetical protein